MPLMNSRHKRLFSMIEMLRIDKGKEKMKDSDNIEALTGWRLFLSITLIFFFVYMAVFGCFVSVLWVWDKVIEPERISSDKIKAAMKYHGVQSAECDWKDQCWFYRNGKRIKL
jgi:hypothetical protein